MPRCGKEHATRHTPCCTSPGVKPEVDGTTHVALATAAALTVEELASVFEQIPSGVVVADCTGRPLLTNRAARRLLGDFAHTSRSLIDVSIDARLREVSSGQRVSPETSVLARTLRGESVSAEEYTVPRGRDRERLRLRVSSVPLRDQRRTIVGAVSIFTDLDADVAHAKRVERLLEVEQRARAETEQALARLEQELAERRRAEEALQEARLAMAQGERLRALGEMASGIAHDLNQSLALISGYSDMARQELLLLHDLPEVGRAREMVEITARAALEGGQALRSLLSFVRSQELLAVVERFNIADLLQDVARLTAPRWRDAPQAEGRPIELDVSSEPGCWINGSPVALREAITNLIFNAVDAMPRGGSLHLVAFRDGEHIVVDVCDTGEGIPFDVQARVFDPFFSTKGERGTGLGLPQVRTIVERHAGSIELHSTPNRGTTFRLVFPRAASPTDSASKPDEKDVSDPQRCVRILVVEDEEQLARMAKLVLTQRGHEVVLASSGDAAVDLLQRDRFELIISDLGLGSGKNGWDVAEAAREHSPDTRFVLVTGWGAAIDPEQARLRGVDEVIAKPYRIADLRRVADRVAGGLNNV
jgi:signal transduction histidine kinase/ActR/RegA family two-component response regulator